MNIIVLFDIIGIVAFGISGFIIATRKGLDIFGVAIMSLATAFGGGIIRDVIMARIPFVFHNYYPSMTLFITFIFCVIFRKFINDRLERKLIFIIMDAIGLVAFAISGSILGIDMQINLFGVMMLSFITAVGGGMIRDILINEIPLLLRSEIYGVVTIYCAFILFLYSYLFHSYNIYIVSFVSISAFMLRMIAYIKNWHLPRLH